MHKPHLLLPASPVGRPTQGQRDFPSLVRLYLTSRTVTSGSGGTSGRRGCSPTVRRVNPTPVRSRSSSFRPERLVGPADRLFSSSATEIPLGPGLAVADSLHKPKTENSSGRLYSFPGSPGPRVQVVGVRVRVSGRPGSVESSPGVTGKKNQRTD